ncbi:cation:proton antiporter [Estrella lausannensis]|uniref:Glutathione-regulated potassium-efflux system protein n=1 Tax=Estrella lausannensis TaxID=483423 RepID=A0A0H5DNR0_9BACT|nr:cation:proton antiporter [Estrella lausannensis]CRX37917.1 glutathione-regulated potassium-efflux system protein [Estrella lausannensis]
MHSNLQIVLILTIGFALASLLAFIAQRFRFPAILGYMLAGYIIGPYSPGFVADVEISEQLAEICVILMLFGVGLHFRIEDLIGVKNIAIPGAVAQTFFAAVTGFLIVRGMGWSPEAALIIGLSIGVASTVVLVRILTDNEILNTSKGHIAVGWLVVEDIFTVIFLILLPTFAAFSSGENISLMSFSGSLLILTGKFLILGLFMFKWGHKIVAYILTNIARLKSQELFTLTILALVFVIATGSTALFGTSIALGAFIAGMVIGKTSVRHQAAANALPLKDIFAVIFFLSVGMLFNPNPIIANYPLFLGVLAVILIVKPLVAFIITVLLGHSLNVALTLSVALAQIGEFSFILAEEAMNLKLLPDDGFDILVACALVSISLNPLLFQSIGWIEKKMAPLPLFRRGRRNVVKGQEGYQFPTPTVIIVGFGQIGKEVSVFLKEMGIFPLIIEQNIDTVMRMEAQDTIFFGDAAESNILKDIHIEQASHLLITVPDTAKTVKIIHTARSVNPDIEIICRSQSIIDEDKIKELRAKSICTESVAMNSFLILVRQLFHPAKK